MKHILVTIAFVVLCTAGLVAQDRKVNLFEIGAGYAPIFLATADDSYVLPYKVDASLELRCDLGRFFDVGAKLDYKLSPTSLEDHYAGYTYRGFQMYSAFLALADFNLRPFDKVGFFAGVGLGPGFLLNNWVAARYDAPQEGMEPQLGLESSDFFFVVVPRVGIELFRHLRLSVSSDLSLADTRWPLCFNIGWIL